MKTDQVIDLLLKSKLVAECPSCNEQFKLTDATLFDGTKPFPEVALEARKTLEEGLKEQEDDLKKRFKLATQKAQITTKAVNVGKSFEKIFPTLKDFKWTLPDCRFLGDPIDFIVFNGYCEGNIKSISFLEVKSGGARLNAHQKSVKDAIEDHKLSYEVFI